MASLEIPHDLIGQSGLYNVPDPLLRRLRIEEPSGKSIENLDKYFKDKEVLILYAGSEYGENNIRAFHRVRHTYESILPPLYILHHHHVQLTRIASIPRSLEISQDLTTFAQANRSAAVLYVSTDLSPAAMDRVLKDKSWLRLTFFDNSDFATVGQTNEERDLSALVEDVKRGEDFVQAGEVEMGVEKVDLGVEEYQNHYVRPLSRAAVTVLMSVFATPSVAVYHLPTHSFVAKNVKMSAFTPTQVDRNYAVWRDGGSPSIKTKLLVKYGGGESILSADARIMAYHAVITLRPPWQDFDSRLTGIIEDTGAPDADVILQTSLIWFSTPAPLQTNTISFRG
ncbi:hypothetical protein I316_02564 [Kwoniella heveanensis BCC8398]|uniref:Uncharacterized protein n=1 Tax=Kwoniella heveanensis BCC8398 TaxID=1296120 RepID=A0A1B9GWV7_9TREE|nr:hypothetical protein I316_02564 [Kwoniella heveanensis BCC8398]